MRPEREELFWFERIEIKAQIIVWLCNLRHHDTKAMGTRDM